MIKFYSGTPGSGKSLHVAKDIYTWLTIYHKNVISTFDINMDIINYKKYRQKKKKRKHVGKFDYVPYDQMTPQYLIQYARQNNKPGKESQTLVVIDECQVIFNPRDFGRADRRDWILFFTHHRHLGYDFILVSQFDRLVDRQIRCLFEYEVKHRRVNNYSFLWLIPCKLFVANTMWYSIRQPMGHDFFRLRKRYADLYDTYAFNLPDLAVDGLDASSVVD